MERPAFRKPRQLFDTVVRPSHVTFDDGRSERRNFPWAHYVEARWDYAEPDTLKVEIGDWLVVVRGFNLAALFLAIEDHTLVRLRAQPDLAKDREHGADTFATEIRFLKAPNLKRRGQIELELGLE